MKTLAISEIEKVTEVLEMTQEQISNIKKQFTSAVQLSKKTWLVKDWMDDSIQIVKIKEEKEVDRFRCSCCDKLKDSRVKKMRKWNNGHIEVAICGTCSSKIRFRGYKTVQGFLNNN